MTGNDWKWLEMDGMAGYGWKWQKDFTYLEIYGNCWKWVEMTGKIWKWMDMA